MVCDGAPDVTGLHDMDEYVQAQLLLAVSTGDFFPTINYYYIDTIITSDVLIINYILLKVAIICNNLQWYPSLPI